MSAISYKGDCPLCGKRTTMLDEFCGKRICFDCHKHVEELERKCLWNAKARTALRLAKQIVKAAAAQPTPLDQALDYAAEEWGAEE